MVTSALAEAELKHRDNAVLDPLTGLLNRRTFNAQLLGRLREAQRYGRPLSLLLLDIDYFKKVNDSHGHPAGDAVLRSVAAMLAHQARECGTHLGGAHQDGGQAGALGVL